jgi:hypothetical protein
MIKVKKGVLIGSIIILTGLLLSGCLPSEGISENVKPAGFLWGIWHGWIAPLSLVVSFFKDGVRIYQVNNTGWFYDFGFYVAVISGFGGLSLFRKNKKKSGD